MKIVIIGYSGSGKICLGWKLNSLLSIPKLHMDTLQISIRTDEPVAGIGWRKKEKWTISPAILKRLVIDGNYSWCCYEERMEQADQIIFLNFYVGTASIEARADHVIIKVSPWRYGRRGLPGQKRLGILRWILWDGRTKSARERKVSKHPLHLPEKFLSLKNQKELVLCSKKHTMIRISICTFCYQISHRWSRAYSSGLKPESAISCASFPI